MIRVRFPEQERQAARVQEEQLAKMVEQRIQEPELRVELGWQEVQLDGVPEQLRQTLVQLRGT